MSRFLIAACALVLSAGLNTPRRAWADQSIAEFEEIIATNLTAVARVVDAALPSLRRRGGQVVVVSSFTLAGKGDFRAVSFTSLAWRSSKTLWLKPVPTCPM